LDIDLPIIPLIHETTILFRLLDIFTQLLIFTSGDVEEAQSWLTALNQEHGLTGEDSGLGDFSGFERQGFYTR
jgi:Ca-activated chloride channel homolog